MPDTSWDTFHHTGALVVTRSVIDGLRVHNYGDAINVRRVLTDFRIRGVHTTFIHDDCVQNDFLYSGVIEGSLFDGRRWSCRPDRRRRRHVDGHAETVTLRRSLLRLEPMPTVYSGPCAG